VPSFASTDGPKSAIPIRNHRYQIPRYPLSGPMTAADGVQAGTGMLVPWTRVSTILDTHEDKEGIFKWTKRLVVKGLGAREDLYALAAATRLEDKAGLLKIADQAFDYAKGQAASNRGTAIHGFLERWVEGDKELVIPDPWKADVAAVMTAFQDANIRLRPDLQEVCVVRPDLKDGDAGGLAGGLAGRLDLVVEMLNPETGEWELILADYKTGSDPLLYGAWKIQQQLGLYGTAWAIWDGTHWRPMPKIRRDKVLMVHVLPGQASVQIHIGDVDPVALEEDLQAAYRTRRRRKEAKKAWRPLVTVEDGNVLAEERTTATIGAQLEETARQAEEYNSRNVDQVPVGPTKPIEVRHLIDPEAAKRIEAGYDAQTVAEQNRAAANVARVAAESNPNLDDDELTPEVAALQEDIRKSEMIRTEPDQVAAFVSGPEAGLAPLAGPGERGCGVCGRKGHRRGSPKCLGEADPHKAKVVEQQESFQRENEGVLAQAVADEERALNGGPTDAEIADGAEPTWCRCTTRSAGWKAPADGVGPWVCGDCGLPSKLGVPLAVQTGEQVTYADALTGEITTAPADQVKLGVSVPVLDEDDPLDGQDSPTEHPDTVETDPFDALTPAKLVKTWLDQIQNAPDKATLRTIRADALAAGEWTKELTQAGLKRIEALAQQG